MLIGGDGAARTEGLLLRGWAYGVLAIAFFAVSFALAVSRPGFGLGSLRWPFGLLTAGYLMAWSAFMVSYARFVAAPAGAPFWGSFPEPTAWMLYVLWPLPMLYMALYLYAFRRVVWTADDEARFEGLLDAGRHDE